MSSDKVNLWHYTTMQGLEGILRNQSIWATHFKHLNDVSEFRYSMKVLHEYFLPFARKIIEEVLTHNPGARDLIAGHGGIERFSSIEVNESLEILYSALLTEPPIKEQWFYSIPCLASFSQVSLEDNFTQENGLLSQWRGYGADGGCAIIFNKEALCQRFKQETESYYYGISGDGDVRYCFGADSSLGDLKGHIDYLCEYLKKFYSDRVFGRYVDCEDVKVLDAIASCMAFLKHGGFAEEKEYRFYVFPYPPDVVRHPAFKDTGKKFKEILFRPGMAGPIPYVNLFQMKDNRLPISRICVGPNRHSAERVFSIKRFLSALSLGDIEVYSSAIPFVGAS